ncbi:anti-sigma factor [Knoellia locipacati]|uniref:anti-sigma factor n=1 Tax=Knoellia locipacati TaxID=882824 RepID=UPI00384FD246
MTPTPRSHDSLTDGTHIAEERLVDLALADVPQGDEGSHLAECPVCGDLLASLRRTVEVARDGSTVKLMTPPPAVWEGIEAELDADPSAVDDPSIANESAGDHSSADRPFAGLMSDETTSAATTTGPPEVVVPLRTRQNAASSSPRRRPPLSWLAAACAAGVLVGAGGFVIADRIQTPGSEPARTVASAELDTLDTQQQLGRATVSEQADAVTLQVSASALDRGASGYVEVWLINRDGKRMVSVGVLGEDAREGSFPISRRLLDEGYVVVDLSREEFDDKPQHSGDSIVRGSLTTPA